MKEIVKKYTNGEITIVWKPSMCIHSTRCWKGEEGLMEVFNPAERPWIKPEGANSERIIAQINQCPSGALSYFRNDEVQAASEASSEPTKIVVSPNGPLLVHGTIRLEGKDGSVFDRDALTALCRCGHSNNKPFCDGAHRKHQFKDE